MIDLNGRGRQPTNPPQNVVILAGAATVFTQADELYNDYQSIYDNSANAYDAFFNLTTSGTLYSTSTLTVDLDGD